MELMVRRCIVVDIVQPYKVLLYGLLTNSWVIKLQRLRIVSFSKVWRGILDYKINIDFGVFSVTFFEGCDMLCLVFSMP